MNGLNLLKKLGTHLGDKLWTNQQFSALKVYNTLDATTEDILEKILEREGTFDLFSMETSSLFQSFLPTIWMQLKKICNDQLKNTTTQKDIDTR